MEIAGMSGQKLLDFCRMVDSGSMIEAIQDEFQMPPAQIKSATEELRQKADDYGGIKGLIIHLSEPTMVKSKRNSNRTSSGLRDALFDTLDGLRRGNIDPSEALAVCAVSNAIVKTVQIEIDYAKTQTGNKADPIRVQPLYLANRDE